MKNMVCTLIGCGTEVRTFYDLFHHMESEHDWSWSKRIHTEFRYTFTSGVSAKYWYEYGIAPSILDSSDSGPASTTQPIGPPPLLQSHKFLNSFVKNYWSGDTQHGPTAKTQHYKELNWHDDAQEGKPPETPESDNKSPIGDDPENFLPLSDGPTKLEEVKFIDKLLRPTRMHYKHLAGDADAIMSADIPTDRYRIKWQKLQLSLNLWWDMHVQICQGPELIVIDEWSVKNVHEKSVKKAVWTYEYDVKLFGPLLDLKCRVQEFKKLSPVMHKVAAREASLACISDVITL